MSRGQLTVGTANISERIQLSLHATPAAMPQTTRLGGLVFNPTDGKIYCFLQGTTGVTGWAALNPQF